MDTTKLRWEKPGRGPEGSRQRLSGGPSTCALHAPAHLFRPARWSYRAGCPESCAPALPTPSPSRRAGGQGSRGRAPSLPGAPRVRALSVGTWAGQLAPLQSSPWTGDTFRFAVGIRAGRCRGGKQTLKQDLESLPACPRLHAEHQLPPQASRSRSPAWSRRTNHQDPGSPGQASSTPASRRDAQIRLGGLCDLREGGLSRERGTGMSPKRTGPGSELPNNSQQGEPEQLWGGGRRPRTHAGGASGQGEQGGIT